MKYSKFLLFTFVIVLLTQLTYAQRNLRINCFYFNVKGAPARQFRVEDKLSANFYKLIKDAHGNEIKNGENDVTIPYGKFDVTIQNSEATKVVVNWKIDNWVNEFQSKNKSKASGTFTYTVPKGRSNDELNMYFIHSQGRFVNEDEYKRLK